MRTSEAAALRHADLLLARAGAPGKVTWLAPSGLDGGMIIPSRNSREQPFFIDLAKSIPVRREGGGMHTHGIGETATESYGGATPVELAHRHIIRIFPLTIDPPSRRLRHEDGREVMIEPRMMQVLVGLADANGSVLSRDDLIVCCWNGRIVGDEAISSVIYRLRKALDELAGECVRIETVPKVGFRLLCAQKPERQVPKRAKRAWLLAASFVGTIALLLIIGFALRQSSASDATASMQVRLTGFRLLSPDLPGSIPTAIGDEMIAAFADDGWVNISTATNASGGPTAYGLGGSVRREGDKLKVITRLANERSGATLWSDSVTYETGQLSRLPRLAVIDASIVVRCGLFAASTHPAPLPDATLENYFGFCANYMMTGQTRKALDFAQKAVRLSPDFSAGWSAVEVAAGWVAWSMPAGPGRDALIREGLAAADRALALDPANSEALAFKNHLIDPKALSDRETLLQRALDARPLACGCEHHYYGDFLAEVGRSNDAIREYQRAVDVLPLYVGSHVRLASSLTVVGRAEEAKEHMDAALELSADKTFGDWLAVLDAPDTGQFGVALKIAQGPVLADLPALRSAITGALQALLSRDAAAKARAAKGMAALPPEFAVVSAKYLGALGANRLALQKIEEAERSGQQWSARAWLFHPSMAGARADPAFPQLAQRLGLIRYWRTTKRLPDFCLANGAPPVCRMIS